jgi:uncharacterized membrane protein YciS (DUF1049 family)
LSSSRPHATLLTATGLLLIALATLMYEILLTRIFSVTMWYHFAFVAISIAMFGMTVGALLVYLLPQIFRPERVKTHLAISSGAFAVSMVFSFLTQLSIPFLVHPSVVAAYAIAFTIAVISVPFVISGMCVSLVLTRFPARVGRLYAADLTGAALGCALLAGVLRLTDAPTAVIAVASIAALGSVAFAVDAGARWVTRLSATVAAMLVLGASVHTVFVWHQFPVLRILYVKGALEARPLYEKWNSYSRVRVNGNPDVPTEPYGWGLSSAWPASRLVRQLKMDIDVSAGTVMTAYSGDPAEVEHLKYDVTNAGYYVRPGPSVAVIGVGGGRDVLSALSFGATSVTAIEINDDIIRTTNGRFGDFTGHLDRDPRVHFVNDEARSYLARQTERFDVIQISLIDTWAATAAGAFVMSENSLYTTEAWNVFLTHLTDTGVLSVSRWYFSERPGEIYRLVALASQALAEHGVANPRAHLMLIRNIRQAREGGQPEGVGTLLVSQAPFSPADVAKLDALTGPMRFEVTLSPRGTTDPTLAALTSGGDVTRFAAAFPINIAPPTDNSPFFFQMFRLRDIADIALLRAGKNSYNMQAVFGVLMITVMAMAAACLMLPMAFSSTRGDLRSAGSLVVYFAAIGLGFMMIETSQMQRLIIVLGHPAYGLSVVLFALLLSSGIGSYFTESVTTTTLRTRGAWRLTALVAALAAFGLVTPWAAAHVESATTPIRVAVSVGILFVPGFLMGMAFPLGMKLARDHERLTPWLWGVNGGMSVCASVVAVGIALTWSISAAFWVGTACYVVALAAFTRAAAAARR